MAKRKNSGKGKAAAASKDTKAAAKPAPAEVSKRPTRGGAAPASPAPTRAGSKRKASPSPSADKKKGRTASPSPAPTDRKSRGRGASKPEVEDKETTKPSTRTPSRGASQKGQVETKPTRATRSVIEDVETKRGRSASAAAKKPATPKAKPETPKQKAATPRQRSATPKTKPASPIPKTPKQKAVTPKKKETPKQKAATAKEKTPKQKQTPAKATPKSSPAPKKAAKTPTPKKTPAKATPQRSSSRSRRGAKEESEETAAENVEDEQPTESETPLPESMETKDDADKKETEKESIDEQTAKEEDPEPMEDEAEEKEDNGEVEDAGEDENVEQDQKEEETEEASTKVKETEETSSPVEKTKEASSSVKTTEDTTSPVKEMNEATPVEAEAEAMEEEVIQEAAQQVQSEVEAEAEVDGAEDVKEDQAESEQVESQDKECESAESEQVEADVPVAVQESTPASTVPVIEINENSSESLQVMRGSPALVDQVIDINEDSGEAVIVEPETGSGVQEISDDDDDVEEIGITPAPVVEVDDIQQSPQKEADLTGIEMATEATENMVIEVEQQSVSHVSNGESSPRKRKHDEVEEDTEEVISPKKARLSECEESLENGTVAQESEAISNDYVVVEMGDVPSSESKEVIESLPKEVTQNMENNVTHDGNVNPLFTRTYNPSPVILDPETDARRFSIMSYNVLADCALFRNDYTFTPKQYLDTNYRLNNVLEEVEKLGADVVCLQEVDPKFFSDWLVAGLKRCGYEGVFKKRTTDFHNEGEATFYKTSKFTLVDSSLCRLADLIEKDIGMLDPTVQEGVRQYMDLPDVMVVTKLCHKTSGKEVTVGNIHVNWGQMKTPDIQCVQIASAIKNIVNEAGADNFPHIICGDFNSAPQSPGYLMARDGYLHQEETITQLQQIKNVKLPEGEPRALVDLVWPAFQHTSSSLKSAYYESQKSEPEITSYNRVMLECVDYIFYSSSSLDIHNVLETCNKAKIMETGGIPNQYFPSDHVSIRAELLFK